MPPKPFYRSKKINVKARLLTAKKALFYLQFHENKIADDSFYKLIKKRCEEHILVSKVDAGIFKYPYDQTGFTFKTNLETSCYNENKEPCLIEDILDKDVILTLSVTPYDFVPKNGNNDQTSRLVGMSIKVFGIRAVKDK
jgi:hypothetical protein